MLLLCYPKCTTCQKAQKWLDNHNILYSYRDIKLENPTFDELKLWLSLSGQPIKKLFNTSGLQYKALNLKEKLPSMSTEDCLKLLATDGMLVKRPLTVSDGFVLIGFKEAEWKERLANSQY